MLFVEAPESEEEVARVAEDFPDTPLLFNWVEGGRTPPVAHDRLRELGYRLIICPLSTLLAATAAVGETLARIREAGTPAAIAADQPAFADFTSVVGLPDVERLEGPLHGRRRAAKRAEPLGGSRCGQLRVDVRGRASHPGGEEHGGDQRADDRDRGGDARRRAHHVDERVVRGGDEIGAADRVGRADAVARGARRVAGSPLTAPSMPDA